MTNAPANPMKEQKIDFGEIFAKYKRHWWMFALSLLLCLGLAAFYLAVKSPVYLVVSKVLVEQDDNASSAGANLLKSLSIGGAGSKVDDEVIVMGSQELLSQMINRLKINRTYVEKKGLLKRVDHYNTSPVEIEAPDALFDTLSIAMTFKITIDEKGKADVKVKKGLFKTLANVKNATLPVTVKTPYGIYVVDKTKYFKAGKDVSIKAQVVGNVPKAELLAEEMTVKVLSKKSSGIYMDVAETNVKRGKDILNTLMILYNERCQREKDEMAVNTGKFIDERLGLIYTELTKSEADIERYKKSHNMIDVGLQTKSLIGKQEAAERSAIALETKYSIMNMVKDFVDNPANKNAMIPFDADSTAASASIKAYNQLVAERVKLSASAKDNNQALQALDDQIAAMHRNVVSGVDNAMRALRVQISRANAVSGSAGGVMSGMPTEEREARALYREQSIQNALYTFLLQKREENALVLAATTPKGKIVDHAYAQSKPIKPKIPVVLFVALLAGVMIPLVLLYMKQLFTTKFATQDELAAIAQAPVIGEICHNRHHEQLVVREGKTSSIVELFRLVRNNIQFMLHDDTDKVLLVTSSVSGEGKSFVSANLAASFALLDKKVALVGLDIRSPKLAEMLDMREQPGITGFLSTKGLGLDDIVQHSAVVPGLDVFVGGVIPPNPSELLLTKHVEELVGQLRERYDMVVVDSAPIAMVSDTFSLAKYADAVLFVTRANYTKRNLIKYLNTVLGRGQLKNVSVVVNDTNPRVSTGYGYGYGTEE